MKNKLNLSIDKDLVLKARERGLNISGIVNELLKQIFKSSLDDINDELITGLIKEIVKKRNLNKKTFSIKFTICDDDEEVDKGGGVDGK